CECEPKIRSTRVPVHLAALVLRSRPSYTLSPQECHSVLMSSRLTKKSLVNFSGCLVRTPCLDPPALAPSTRRPPTRTVISGAVSLNNCARPATPPPGPTTGGSLRRWWGKPPRPGGGGEKESPSVSPCDAPPRPGVRGPFAWPPASFAAFSTAAHPPRTIRSASE